MSASNEANERCIKSGKMNISFGIPSSRFLEMLLYAKLLVFSVVPAAIAASPKLFTFNIVNAEVAPDGFTRDAVVVNGKFPGPVVAVNKGDSVKIETNNKLTNPHMRRSTSIHWHGFFQARTSGMDGPS
ncbi:hypothetical protein H0H87_007629 [Tephrocybe sp. NHM501043]|nr:hypothetical protein H0H87_007629 [Tephrocybe sp. NHM501043]